MANASEKRQQAEQLPHGDVIRLLLSQHARIQELLDEVETLQGQARREAFEELRALLVIHETAEELIVRPVTEKIAPAGLAVSRMQEQKEANELLEQLRTLDVDGPDFTRRLAELKSSVATHTDRAEQAEFPVVLNSCDDDYRQAMGRRVSAAEKLVPARPHPPADGSSAEQWPVGPFVTLVDRAKDAIASVDD